MLSNAHSRTAEVTAAIRASHLLYDAPTLFEDRFALALTSPMWRTVCRHRWLHDLIVRGLMKSLRPVHGWILARDFMTESCLQQFIAAGHNQFVLLGAGFDSTALREPPWLNGVRVIEVDHPATQAVKLARISRLGHQLNDQFEAVAVDFEHEGLASALTRSSFDRTAPALFAWQGVIYYLTDAAIRDTLGGVAEVAVPGSELLFDFLLPEQQTADADRRVLSLARMVTARMGERYISYHSVDDVTALLDEAGFDVIEVALGRDLEARYCAGRDDDLSVMRGCGIAHARRR